MNNDSIYDSIQRAIRAIQGDYQKSITDVISTINKDMSKLFDTDFFRQINRRVDEYEINIKTGWWYPGSIIDDLPANETEAALGSEEYNKAFTKLVVRQSRKMAVRNFMKCAKDGLSMGLYLNLEGGYWLTYWTHT